MKTETHFVFTLESGTVGTGRSTSPAELLALQSKHFTAEAAGKAAWSIKASGGKGIIIEAKAF